MGKMNIGVAAGKITPNGPISLCGQFETRISRYVESDLMANCMVLDLPFQPGLFLPQEKLPPLTPGQGSP